MATARQTIGSYCFKISVIKILKQCNWLSIPHMVLTSSLKFIHKMFTVKQPKCLLNLFNLRSEYKNSDRITTKYYPICKPTLQIVENSILYKASSIYNMLPNYLLQTNIKDFTNQIDHYVVSNFEHDKMP